MGFGTGLNAFLTYQECERLNVRVSYTGIETDPVDSTILDELNYFPDDPLFSSMHQSVWDTRHDLSDLFDYKKVNADVMTYDFDQKYDVIYYDAFAPQCQGQLWEAPLHQKIYDALNPYGVLVTYCAKGAFKRMLRSLGYKLESLNGPGKKREMIRAIKA